MIWFLRVFFLLILLTMLAVTTYASLHAPIWRLSPVLTGDPWFQATLFDAYFGFLTFFVWVAYKEASWGRSVVWLILIMLLGNIAMSIYMLIQLFRAPTDAPLREVFPRK